MPLDGPAGAGGCRIHETPSCGGVHLDVAAEQREPIASNRHLGFTEVENRECSIMMSMRLT
jgi:hypothetical protein